MDLSKLPLFDLLNRRIAWLSQRQQVLAHNIANSDTPGFKPLDLKPMDFKAELQSAAAGPTRTNAMHLTGGSGGSGEGKDLPRITTGSYETSPNGNAVVIEEQLLKVAETQLEYQTVTNLYSKNLQLIKMAIGRASG